MNQLPSIEFGIGLVIDNKYRLDALIMDGVDGKLFLAEDLSLTKKVFIHLYLAASSLETPDFTAFKQAAKQLLTLEHSNIIKLVDYGITTYNTPYTISEYFEAISLRDYLLQHGTLSERVALAIAQQICSALHYAHLKNIWHLQLKPEHIWLEEYSQHQPIVKITGFSLAKDTLSSYHAQHSDDSLLGNNRYAAPEQITASTVDSRTDIFVLSIIIYEMLTGLVAAAIATTQPLRELRPDTSPKLGEILLKGLAPAPKDRYQSIFDLKSDLEIVQPISLTDASTQYSPEGVTILSGEKLTHNGTPAPLIIEQSLSHYHILAKLGEGGMGEVYLAEDTRLKRKVALKLLPNELTQDHERIERLELEARAASALNHPNIITIYEIGASDNMNFIATEYIDGQTLREIMAKPMEIEEVLPIALQIASALAAAHPAGIIHRDIKPGNIMLRPDGYIKILDFGLAKFVEDQANPNNDQELGKILGTPKYMSPEQALGQHVDARTDIFSFGVLLYEMLAGVPPFQGESNIDIINEILQKEPLPISHYLKGMPVELEQILHRALQKGRTDRYHNIKEMLKELKTLKHRLDFEAELSRSNAFGLSIEPTTKEPISIVAPPPVRAKWPWVMLSATIIVAFIAVCLSLFVHPVANREQRTLAIMPFRNLKPDSQTDFLGFSLADAVITKLSYIQTLTVRPSSAIDRYRNQNIDTDKVAQELKVNTVLTGSFLREGDDLHITTQLVDTQANKVIWRKNLDLKYEKLITIQNQVADEIVKGLELNLSAAEAKRFNGDIPSNPLAYEYCLRGRDLLSESANNYSLAREMLEKSVEVDPGYAPAWAYLGLAYNSVATAQFGGEEYYTKARDSYEKSIKLNPEQIEARLFTAILLTDTGKVDEAIPLLKGVLKTNPNLAKAHWELSYSYRYGGMLNESKEEGETALKLDPSVANRTFNTYLYLGDYNKFLSSLPVRKDAYFIFYRGFAYYHLENYQEAAQLFDQAYELAPTSIFGQIGRALSLSIGGKTAEGIALMKSCEERISEKGVHDGEAMYKIAQVYAMLGEREAALRMLQHSIESGFFCYPYFVKDKLLDNIRNLAEFQKLLDLARTRHEKFRKIA